jgi:hypothetical protein
MTPSFGQLFADLFVAWVFAQVDLAGVALQVKT